MPVAAGRGQVAFQRGRGVTVAGMTRLRPGGPIGRPPARIDARGIVRTERSAEPDLPRSLTDLDLPEPARTELGDEGRQEILGQPPDRGMILEPIGQPACIRATRGTGARGAGRVGRRTARAWTPHAHRSDLAAGRRLVGPA
jgi:hypothetical protein